MPGLLSLFKGVDLDAKRDVFASTLAQQLAPITWKFLRDYTLIASMLNAFARFTSRRGISEEVCSDYRNSFVGAASELSEFVKRLD